MTYTLLRDSLDLALDDHAIPSEEVPILKMLFASYAPSVYDIIAEVVCKPELAVQILEKTFVYAFRHIREHNTQITLLTWLLQIVNLKILEEAANSLFEKKLPNDLPFIVYANAWEQLEIAEQEVLEWLTIGEKKRQEMSIEKDLSIDFLKLRMADAFAHFYSLLETMSRGNCKNG